MQTNGQTNKNPKARGCYCDSQRRNIVDKSDISSTLCQYGGVSLS